MDPFPLVMQEPRFDMSRLYAQLAFAHACMPNEASIMKPLSPMMEIIEDGKILDRARATWHRRKRRNRKRPVP